MSSFFEQVQQAGQLSSTDEAAVLVRATLRILGEAISLGQADELGQGLPAELRQELSLRSGQAGAMEKADFLNRVSGELTATGPDVTEARVRAVLSTLRTRAPGREVNDTVAQLSQPLAALFK